MRNSIEQKHAKDHYLNQVDSIAVCNPILAVVILHNILEFDEQTTEHSLNVTIVDRELHTDLPVPHHPPGDLDLSSILHDTGKMAVCLAFGKNDLELSRKILNPEIYYADEIRRGLRPRRTREEIAAMDLHPIYAGAIAERVLEKMPHISKAQARKISDEVYWHQSLPDNSIKKSSPNPIFLPPRKKVDYSMALADGIAARLERRPYRMPYSLPPHTVLSEIQEIHGGGFAIEFGEMIAPTMYKLSAMLDQEYDSHELLNRMYRKKEVSTYTQASLNTVQILMPIIESLAHNDNLQRLTDIYLNVALKQSGQRQQSALTQ